MKRYIDADELLTKLPDDLPYKASVKRVLMQTPTADVVEVKHGKWKYVDGDLGYSDLECSECGAITVFFDDERFNYCPNCGAKMDGERREYA